MNAPTNPPLDRLGREITIGAYVVQAASYGSSASMNIGKVTDIVSKVDNVILEYGAYDPATNTRAPNRTELQNVYKVKVRHCDEKGVEKTDTPYNYSRGTYGDPRPARAVTIEHLDRLAVITLV